jgi:hypothetical protein
MHELKLPGIKWLEIFICNTAFTCIVIAKSIHPIITQSLQKQNKNKMKMYSILKIYYV